MNDPFENEIASEWCLWKTNFANSAQIQVLMSLVTVHISFRGFFSIFTCGLNFV